MGGTKDKGPVSPLWVRIRDKARAGSFCVTLLYPHPQPSLHFWFVLLPLQLPEQLLGPTLEEA